jgi:hypothetical protein
MAIRYRSCEKRVEPVGLGPTRRDDTADGIYWTTSRRHFESSPTQGTEPDGQGALVAGCPRSTGIATRVSQESLEMMHVSVQERRTKKQQDAIHRHNARAGFRYVDFHVGDYVLQAKLLRHRCQKTMARWYGPKMVTKALSNFIFEVEDLITKRRDECHISRLLLYLESKVYKY